METHRGAGVAMHEQILNERDENYGKVISRYALAGKSALEDLLDHGETRITLIFQHSAMLPHPPNACQMQSKKRAAGKLTLSAELPCLSLLFTLLLLLFLCIAVDHNRSDGKPCLCRARRYQLQIMLLDNRRGIPRLIGHLWHVFVDGNERRNASMPQRVLLPLDASILGDLLLEPVKEAVAARPDRLMRPDVWIQPLGQRLVDRDGPPAVRFGDPSFQINDPVSVILCDESDNVGTAARSGVVFARTPATVGSRSGSGMLAAMIAGCSKAFRPR